MDNERTNVDDNISNTPFQVVSDQEEWEQWHPTHALGKKYRVECFIFRCSNGLEIELVDAQDNASALLLRFEQGAYSYNKAALPERQSLLEELSQKYSAAFHEEWSFFIVKNSHYLQWLSEQSVDIIDRMRFLHYVVLAQNSVIDIASTQKPELWDNSQE